MLPDYRGGVSVTRSLRREGSAWLADASLDALYVSRFNQDFLVYTQSRAGYDFGPVQLHWNGNVTIDARRQDWANFVETGPGIAGSPRAIHVPDVQPAARRVFDRQSVAPLHL